MKIYLKAIIWSIIIFSCTETSRQKTDPIVPTPSSTTSNHNENKTPPPPPPPHVNINLDLSGSEEENIDTPEQKTDPDFVEKSDLPEPHHLIKDEKTEDEIPKEFIEPHAKPMHILIPCDTKFEEKLKSPTPPIMISPPLIPKKIPKLILDEIRQSKILYQPIQKNLEEIKDKDFRDFRCYTTTQVVSSMQDIQPNRYCDLRNHDLGISNYQINALSNDEYLHSRNSDRELPGINNSEKDNEKQMIEFEDDSLRQFLENSYELCDDFWRYRVNISKLEDRDVRLEYFIKSIIHDPNLNTESRFKVLRFLIEEQGIIPLLEKSENNQYRDGCHWYCFELFGSIMETDDTELMDKVLTNIKNNNGDLSKMFSIYRPITEDSTSTIYHSGNLYYLFAHIGKSAEMAQILLKHCDEFKDSNSIGYYNEEEDATTIRYSAASTSFLEQLEQRQDLGEDIITLFGKNKDINLQETNNMNNIDPYYDHDTAMTIVD